MLRTDFSDKCVVGCFRLFLAFHIPNFQTFTTQKHPTGKNLKYLFFSSRRDHFFKLSRSQIYLQNRSKFSRRQKLVSKCQIFSKKCPKFVGFCLFLANFLLQEAIFIFLLHFFVVIICSSFPGDRILLKFAFKNRSKFSRRGTCLEQIF